MWNNNINQLMKLGKLSFKNVVQGLLLCTSTEKTDFMGHIFSRL